LWCTLVSVINITNTTFGQRSEFGGRTGRDCNNDILQFLIIFSPPDCIDRRYVDQHHFRPAPTVITKRTAITSNVHGSSSVSSNQSITTNTSTKISDTVISSRILRPIFGCRLRIICVPIVKSYIYTYVLYQHSFPLKSLRVQSPKKTCYNWYKLLCWASHISRLLFYRKVFFYLILIIIKFWL